MNLNPLILSEPRPDPKGDLRPGYMDLRYRLQEDLLASSRSYPTRTGNLSRFSAADGWARMEYCMEDAQHALVSMGSLASECTIAADAMREQGLLTGVVGACVPAPSG